MEPPVDLQLRGYPAVRVRRQPVALKLRLVVGALKQLAESLCNTRQPALAAEVASALISIGVGSGEQTLTSRCRLKHA